MTGIDAVVPAEVCITGWLKLEGALMTETLLLHYTAEYHGWRILHHVAQLGWAFVPRGRDKRAIVKYRSKPN